MFEIIILPYPCFTHTFAHINWLQGPHRITGIQTVWAVNLSKSWWFLSTVWITLCVRCKFGVNQISWWASLYLFQIHIPNNHFIIYGHYSRKFIVVSQNSLHFLLKHKHCACQKHHPSLQFMYNRCSLCETGLIQNITKKETRNVSHLAFFKKKPPTKKKKFNIKIWP